MQKDKFITVMAVLDDKTQESMESIAKDMLQQYGPDRKTKGIPYHISLGSYAPENLHLHFDSDYANGYSGWAPHATLYIHEESREALVSEELKSKIDAVKSAKIVGIELGEFFPAKFIIREMFEE